MNAACFPAGLAVMVARVLLLGVISRAQTTTSEAFPPRDEGAPDRQLRNRKSYIKVGEMEGCPRGYKEPYDFNDCAAGVNRVHGPISGLRSVTKGEEGEDWGCFRSCYIEDGIPYWNNKGNHCSGYAIGICVSTEQGSYDWCQDVWVCEDHNLRMSMIVFGSLFFVSMLITSIAGCIAFCYAHAQRTQMLHKAKTGQPCDPPSGCWRYCCGACAVYYWEGCSANYFITCCLCPWFAICCWTPPVSPMENGVMVGQSIAVGGAALGQPTMGVPVKAQG